MFSGIAQWQAPILSIDQGLFTVFNIFDKVVLGQSIAHDGACMTVTEIGDESYSFFAMQETLEKTNFQDKKVWQSFNVEQCIKYGDLVDGHFVSWHIDTTGFIYDSVQREDASHYVTIATDVMYRPYLIDKGSVALNGISLTVIDPHIYETHCLFSVSLIPFTLAHTNRNTLQKDDRVNIEYDMIAKYAVWSL